MSGMLLSLLLQSSLVAAGADTYSDAYAKMEASGEPMLVVVGADWCPACVTMKRSTIPSLIQGGHLENIPVVFVNSDREPQLAGKLMRGGTIPQIMVFKNTPNGWHRRQLTGRASSGSVLAMVNEARKLEGVKAIETKTATSEDSSTSR